ncbi:hypothetical protein C1H57_22100 [Clostridium sp. 2-1]|uniref:hypothetical protein n=1 Tax=Clostridium TaxID=1485 RepID=UPI000CDAA0B1|nr:MULTISPECIES: hypothetical protein [Clostridium]MBN7577013.1 hypothetical protein [Clostridium beijerinckii]MBN7580160.1 hypothetical protein [Clostridium beijerinckii]MBN7586794.1 hypothetical protein [Clostridium beijerinckii]MBO0522997.1 hypothetical protein [Clostridium beijerinckii]POO89147.1 hypothetical protein C1H57_22100 [Clostridium sp. 2-1]
MEFKRTLVKYIEGKNSDGDNIAGAIVSVFNKEIIIGVTEKHGGDAEVSLNIEMAKELVNAINSAIKLTDNR